MLREYSSAMTDHNAHFVLDILPSGESLISNAVGVDQLQDGTTKAVGWLGITHNWIGFIEAQSTTPHTEIMPATRVQSFDFTPVEARATVLFTFDDGYSLEFNGNAIELSKLLTAFSTE